jgi:hypothetical protein
MSWRPFLVASDDSLASQRLLLFPPRAELPTSPVLVRSAGHRPLLAAAAASDRGQAARAHPELIKAVKGAPGFDAQVEVRHAGALDVVWYGDRFKALGIVLTFLATAIALALGIHNWTAYAGSAIATAAAVVGVFALLVKLRQDLNKELAP